MRKSKPALAPAPQDPQAIESFIGDKKVAKKEKKTSKPVKETKSLEEKKDSKKTKEVKPSKEAKDSKKAKSPKKTEASKVAKEDKISKFLVSMKKSIRKSVKLAATESGISMNDYIVAAALEKMDRK